MKTHNNEELGGKFAIIVHALCEANVVKFVDSLRLIGSHRINPHHLHDVVVADREYLVFSLLCDLGVVVALTAPTERISGVLNVDRLDWLEEHLQMTLGVINQLAYSPNSDSMSFQELAWTLPIELHTNVEDLPAKQSLAALTKYAFSLAQDKLLLVSPFLDEDSAKWLSTALKGATKRHVRVYLISHGLNEGNEQIKRTLAIYRDSTPDIRIFTTAKRKKPSYFLLHAKLTIADVKYAVLSTANLTQYGLRSHLEVGVGLTGEPVRHLEQLISQLLLTNLVEEVR